jgi:acyl dehydratase
MPIDIEKVRGAELPAAEGSWSPDDVILYHLGVGAGVPPTDPGELEYAYEGKLKVLPSFAVTPVFSALFGLIGLEGMDINLAMLLHGEQDLEVHRPLPTEAQIHSTARVAEIYDKGKGALVVLEVLSSNGDGEPLFTNRFSAFIRGEGGFGGESGPAPGNAAPDREPDLVVERTTLPQQALLYRLSGDKNPLHADPDFSKLGGFDQPILHGLCSYGIVCKAVVDEALNGDVARLARYRARFAGVVFPGETIVVQMWHEDGQVLVAAHTKERETPVITNAAVTLR